MFKLDFSDIKRNGFRINQFRLFHSPGMTDSKFTSRQKELKTADDLIGERNLMIEYLVERNEISFTLYYFSVRILVVLILVAGITILLYTGGLILKLLLMITTSIFYLLSIRFKESFVMSNFGIQLAESIYNSKIPERYNF